MIKYAFKQPLFVCGLLVVMTLFVLSFFVDPSWNMIKGKYAGATPPSLDHWLGTDEKGKDMVMKILSGAKYTIGLSLCIALFRITLSVVFAFLISSYSKKISFIIKHVFNSLSFTPAVIVIYILLIPFITVYSWNFDTTTKFLIITFCMALVAVPTLSTTFAGEIEQIYKKEFIICSRTLGGRKLHILWKHIVPYLRSRMLILFVQNTIQVLLLFAHLGLLGMYVGGTEIQNMGSTILVGSHTVQAIDPEPVALTNEWGGLIADGRIEFFLYNWLLYGPVIFLTITTLALALIGEGLKRAADYRGTNKKRKHKKRKHQQPNLPFDFSPVKHKQFPHV